MKFDDWFANQARKSFDSYEEIPDSETMQQFSALLKKRQSPFSQPIYWAAAAAIVLSLGFGFYFTKMNPFTASQDVEVAQNLIEETPQSNNQLIISTDSLVLQNENLAEIKINQEPEQVSLNQKNHEINNSFAANSKPKKTIPDTPDIGFSKNLISEYQYITVFDSLTSKETKAKSSLTKINFLAENLSKKEKYDSIDHNYSPIKVKSQNRRSIDVTMGSMVTFADNELSDGLGYAVGAMHYWRISNAIQLGTGGYLSQNSSSYSSNKDFANVLFVDFINANESTPVTVYEEQRVQTITMEIPLLAQYDFSSQLDKGWSFGLGISSLFYLKQSFYNSGQRYFGSQVISTNGEVNTVLNTEPFENEENIPALEKSDWAGLFNISTRYRISKRWETEVFLKYPMQAITAKDLKLSFTGFNIRYRFYSK
jgi:hypothetical protein